MHTNSEEEENVRAAAQNLHEPEQRSWPSGFHPIKYQKHHLDGIEFVIQGQVMQQTVEAQKNLMKNVDFDKLEDIRDQMEEMKFESDYTNELLNRNFDVGVDDIDLDAEMEAMDS